VETSAAGIDYCIKDHMVILPCGFSKYFQEVLSDTYKWITDPFHVDSPPNYDFSLEEVENYIDIISHTSLKMSFLGSRT
jgi:uncharacterized protein YdaL